MIRFSQTGGKWKDHPEASKMDDGELGLSIVAMAIGLEGLTGPDGEAYFQKVFNKAGNPPEAPKTRADAIDFCKRVGLEHGQEALKRARAIRDN